jgi:hypothetical protein
MLRKILEKRILKPGNRCKDDNKIYSKSLVGGFKGFMWFRLENRVLACCFYKERQKQYQLFRNELVS